MITAKELNILSDFNFYFDYHTRQKEVNTKEIDVTKLPYIFVKDTFYNGYLKENKLFEGTKKALGLLKISTNKLTLKELTSIFFFLYDEMLTNKGTIYRLEKEFLSSKPNPDYQQAGARRLAPFNTLLTLYHLSNKNILEMEKVGALPFYQILDIQAMNTIETEIQRNYAEILSKKRSI